MGINKHSNRKATQRSKQCWPLPKLVVGMTYSTVLYVGKELHKIAQDPRIVI